MRNGVVFTLLVVRKTYFNLQKDTETSTTYLDIREYSFYSFLKLFVTVALILCVVMVELEIIEAVRAKSVDDSPLPQPVKKLVNQESAQKINRHGSFKFRPGFLNRKRRVVPRSTERSLRSEIDLSKEVKLINNGNTSMVYGLQDKSGDIRGVFKPEDIPNEGKLVSNTRNETQNEVLAYEFDLLTAEEARAGVPETEEVRFPSKMFNSSNTGNEITGSLQRFIPKTESSEDYGPSMFSKDDVHKIGVLDLRILNCDRHAGNMLFSRDDKKLIPIDHSLSFPTIDNLKNISFDWMLFPQSKLPFSEEMVNAIRRIDLDKQLELMKRRGLNPEQRKAVIAGTTVLKVGGVKYRKSLYDLGCIVQRRGNRSSESILESLIAKVEETDEERFREEFEKVLEDLFKV